MLGDARGKLNLEVDEQVALFTIVKVRKALESNAFHIVAAEIGIVT